LFSNSQVIDMAKLLQNLRMLNCEVECSKPEDSHFRILVDEKHVKYITIAPGVFSPDDMTWDVALIPLLPKLPLGDWNVGHIVNNSSGAPEFAWTKKDQLPGIKDIWHPECIDILSLKLDKIMGNVFEASSMRFPEPVIAKFARFWWEVDWYAKETEIYRYIQEKGLNQEKGLTPKFLGHLAEEGRIIGFVLEKCPGRHAGPENLAACREIVSKLHAIGILHGDVNRHNFLVSENGSVVMIDFESATQCSDNKLFQQELESLELELSDESGRGGIITYLTD